MFLHILFFKFLVSNNRVPMMGTYSVILRQAASSTTTPCEIYHEPEEQKSSGERYFFIGDVAIMPYICSLA